MMWALGCWSWLERYKVCWMAEHAPMSAKSQCKQANKERRAIYILMRNPSSNTRNKENVKSIFIQANL